MWLRNIEKQKVFATGGRCAAPKPKKTFGFSLVFEVPGGHWGSKDEKIDEKLLREVTRDPKCG